MNCKQISWSGRETFELTAGGYGAWLVPSLGANVLRLWYDPDGGHEAGRGGHDAEHGAERRAPRFEVLRTPADAETLLRDPYAYGVPVLLPANRVADGFYEWEGIRYEFPQNYPNGVHIHGVLHNRPWPVKRHWVDSDGAWVRMELDTASDKELRRAFPMDVVIRLEIGLSDKGLVHLFTAENHGERGFPVGLAYHTALNTPFCPSSNINDVRVSVPIQAFCIDDPRDRLPTGKTRELDALEKSIASADGGNPLEKTLDYLYTACLDKPRVAVVRDMAAGWEVTYTAENSVRYWILWNATTKEGFIAIEPQTWMSNAMKQSDPGQFGAIFVPPGGTWTSRTEIALRPCGKGTD